MSAPYPIDAILETERHGFDELAESVLAYQRQENPVYRRFSQVARHLPVEAFKRTAVTTFPAEEAEAVFQSSGTGSGTPSRHYVRYRDDYRAVVTAGYTRIFGDGPRRIIAHLPAYAETSSLVAMASDLMERFGADGSGFFLDDPGLLDRAVHTPGAPIWLIGAAFGLLDLVDERPRALPEGSVVVETGGMKTHRRSIPRTELHARLQVGFSVPVTSLWSEYGMCELMSQAWGRSGEAFESPPWMKVSIVNPEDPVREVPAGQTGAIAVVDLANQHSASAILTQDRGRMAPGDRFEVLGRLTGAELRGCNHLMEQV
ncbi:MAG: hypothetical protein JJ896_18100 [Rhodothermales bacterium]|nr:hypothetical protein [Rhodothermales bacterium]MBO6781577.1 hypothetical protein [Rhodothermales bacterium]